MVYDSLKIQEHDGVLGHSCSRSILSAHTRRQISDSHRSTSSSCEYKRNARDPNPGRLKCMSFSPHSRRTVPIYFLGHGVDNLLSHCTETHITSQRKVICGNLSPSCLPILRVRWQRDENNTTMVKRASKLCRHDEE